MTRTITSIGITILLLSTACSSTNVAQSTTDATVVEEPAATEVESTTSTSIADSSTTTDQPTTTSESPETTTTTTTPTTTTEAPPAVQRNTLIQLIDPHDEPEHYCVDVRGVGATLDIDAALTAHTCKPYFDDELFDVNVPDTGQLYMPAYDRCVEATAADSGAELYIVSCNESDLQRFRFLGDQTVRLTFDQSLCLGVGESAGEPTGGPSHLRRLLRLYSCDDHPTALTTWLTPGPALID